MAYLCPSEIVHGVPARRLLLLLQYGFTGTIFRHAFHHYSIRAYNYKYSKPYVKNLRQKTVLNDTLFYAYRQDILKCKVFDR